MVRFGGDCTATAGGIHRTERAGLPDPEEIADAASSRVTPESREELEKPDARVRSTSSAFSQCAASRPAICFLVSASLPSGKLYP